MTISRVFCATVAAAVILTAPGVATRTQAAVPQTLIEQRILAQQGLAVGLATITLRSQFVAFGAIFFDAGCQSIGGGGSFDVISSTVTASGASGRIQIFFDSACTQLYIDETLSILVVSSSPPTYNVNATAQIYSKAAKKVGTLKLTNNKLSGPTATTLKLVGVQNFNPVTPTAPDLDMGISCEMPRNSTSPSSNLAAMARDLLDKLAGDIVCTAGVAQDFSAIGKATASLSKITLRIDTAGKVTFFHTAPAQLKTGALGALSVNVSPAGIVSIAGPSAAFGTTTLAGQASQLSLLPPKPVTWTVTDQGHGAKFTIQLLDNTTRKLAGGIKSLSNTLIAPIALDQSGTGTIKYSNGVVGPISSWVLAK